MSTKKWKSWYERVKSGLGLGRSQLILSDFSYFICGGDDTTIVFKLNYHLLVFSCVLGRLVVTTYFLCTEERKYATLYSF